MFETKFDVNDYSQVEMQVAFSLLETHEVQDYINAENEVDKAYDRSYGNGHSAYDARVSLLDGTNSDGSDMSYSQRSAALDSISEYERAIYTAVGASAVYGRIVRDKVWNFACEWNSDDAHESISSRNVMNILDRMFDAFGMHTL